jgi:hypothetical protein
MAARSAETARDLRTSTGAMNGRSTAGHLAFVLVLGLTAGCSTPKRQEAAIEKPVSRSPTTAAVAPETPSEAAAPGPSNEAPTRSVSNLAQRVLQQDYTVQRDAKAMGDAALVELEPLLQHAEPDVRELAVLCVGESGGERAVELLLPRLRDDDPQVAMAALQGISLHLREAHVLELLQAHDAGVDPEVDPELVMLLGRYPAPLLSLLQSGTLHERHRSARDPKVRASWQAVLAQLGDDAARRDFVEALGASVGETRKTMLDRSERIGGAWLLPALDPVLDDLTKLVRVGVDARPDLIDSLRARELAMLAVDAIAKRDPSVPPFEPSFAISRSVQYTDAQAAEMQRWLRRLPRPPAVYGPTKKLPK